MRSFLFSVLLFLSFTQLFSQKESSFPAWIFEKTYYGSKQYAVGISDPNMDSIAAFKQATQRALINYGIFNNCKYSSLTTIAIGNEQENTFDATSIETILYTSIIKGNFEISDSVQLEKKEFTQYDECCVLLKKISENSGYKTSFSYSIIRRTGFQKENNIFPVFIDELEITSCINDSLQANYLINRKGKKYNIQSELGDNNHLEKTHFKNEYRNYTPSTGSDNEINSSYYSSLSTGLWAAYIFELSDQISFSSILNKNKANQLVTLAQGNINQNNEIASLNNFILSSKKLGNETLTISIEDIYIQANHLKIELKQFVKSEAVNYQNNSFSRLDKKRQKQLVKENWSAYGFSDVETAFSELKAFEINDNYLSGSIKLEAQNLGNGILKGLQISRTEIENQLKSKINAQSKQEIENEGDLSAVQTSKTVITEKTQKMKPAFIFYRKINKNYYQLEIILFYKLETN